MSQAMQEAIAEYKRIAEMFRNGDPGAEEAWRKFQTQDNGWSLACGAIMRGVRV